MDKKVKRKWLKALRSGEYEQTTHFLCREGEKFCCLGVLCDVQGGYWSDQGPFWTPILPSGRPAKIATYPPKAYTAGISSRLLGELVSMNDTGKSFAEIADFIEREL